MLHPRALRQSAPHVWAWWLLVSASALFLSQCLRPGPLAPDAPGGAGLDQANRVAQAPTQRAPRAEEGVIRINPNKVLRSFDKREILGSNVAIWHTQETLEDPIVQEALKLAGVGLMRLPGGSASDQYFWNGNGVRDGDKIDVRKYDPKTHTWDIDYSDWKPGFSSFWGFPKNHLVDKVGWPGHVDVKDQLEFSKRLSAGAVITVNAGNGSARDAAEWVRWVKKVGYDVRYWEVGNELGGAWESGTLRPDGKTMDGAMYGSIYSEFSRAMKAADASIKVGTQGGADFIRGALARKEAPIDFVTFHDYYNADNDSSQARFKTLDRIRPQIAEVRQAITELRPGQDIKIGITEYNCKLFEDEGTADVLSGLWTVGAIGEMLYGGLDFATQWDTFTQKVKQGGGHGFIIAEGAVRKAQYWSFVLLNAFLGDRLLEIEDSLDQLRTYASKDREGSIYLLVLNTDEHATAEASLDVDGRALAPIAAGARFSRHEYAWDKGSFLPLFNNGPTPLSVSVVPGEKLRFPPFSVTALRLKPVTKAPALMVEGNQETVISISTNHTLSLRAFNAQGKPAAQQTLSISLSGSGFSLDSDRLTTDANGRAQLQLGSREVPTQASLSIKAPGFKELQHIIRSVKPSLLVTGPTRTPTGTSAQFFGAVRYEHDGEFRLLHSYSGVGTQKLGQAQAESVRFEGGLGQFNLSSDSARTETLEVGVGKLAAREPVTFYDTEVKEVLALTFNDNDSLRHADGKVKHFVNQNVRANQGVLEVQVPGSKGWTQDVVNFAELHQIPALDRKNIVGVSLDLMPARDFESGGQMAELVLVLQSEGNYWMPLKGIDLTKLKAGEWQRVSVPIEKPEFLEVMKALFKIVTVLNSGGEVKGSLYLDNLAFNVTTEKK